MAGSRRDKLGSIFSRLTGLLRSGAMKEEDRPIWYDVVKAFPPLPKPPPKRNIPNILYPEDFVRVHFSNTFSDPGATRLADGKTKSVQQRFVAKYLELHEEKSVPADRRFEDTVRILREEGVKLITHEERKQAADKFQGETKIKHRQPEKLDPQDPYIANTTTIVSSKPGKPQPKTEASSSVNIDSLFEEPR
ncbi:28S ribosomal protein S23, mitochondrial-like [Elysia marginata]|uniref:28S ribosomal protein S23, mitochondrial-like n=1 Tax=Elysia marginata TaxID=1093978 RepID=A0AAV4ES48_9GAST|nr:28S ribosomal protein S23, mitochondrial-like [Elysia marginata]